MLNPRLETLSDYAVPAPRQAACADRAAPRPGAARSAIGQPMHPLPALLRRDARAHAHLWGRYPPVAGTPAFREAGAAWLDPPLPPAGRPARPRAPPAAGRRHQGGAVHDRPGGRAGAQGRRRPAVLMPNPFYNVYLGGGGDRRRRAGAAAGIGRDRLSARARCSSPRCSTAPPPSTSARRPIPKGAAADLAYLQRADPRSPATSRLRPDGRRMLRRDLYRAAAGRRARGRARAGRRPRQPPRLPFAVQALERGRAALRLRRRRPGGDRRLSPGCAATLPRSSRCR